MQANSLDDDDTCYRGTRSVQHGYTGWAACQRRPIYARTVHPAPSLENFALKGIARDPPTATPRSAVVTA